MAILRDSPYASTMTMLASVAVSLNKTAHDAKGKFTSDSGGHATADEIGRVAHAAGTSKAHKEAATAHASESSKHIAAGDMEKGLHHAKQANVHQNQAASLARAEKAAKKTGTPPTIAHKPTPAPTKPAPTTPPSTPKLTTPTVKTHESAFDHDAASAWSHKMTTSERAAVDFYKGPGYVDLNDGLRRGKGAHETPWKGTHDPAKLDQHKAALDGALAKSSAPSDLRATRVLGAGIDPSSFKVGGTLKDHGYMSTSVGHSTFEPERGKTVAVMTIKIPKGTPGGFIRDKSSSAVTENEFLLPRGSTLRFNKVEQRDGVHHIEAEVVHGG